MNHKEIKELTVEITVDGIKQYAANRGEANFQILDLIMPYERRVRSIVGGLEGSMGKTVWEKLATELARENGYDILDGKTVTAPENIPESILADINNIFRDREHELGAYDAESTRGELKRLCAQIPRCKRLKPPRGSGIDVWIKKNGREYGFDTKTVQPNIGDHQKYLRQILNWYINRFSEDHTADFRGSIVFPYNPYPKQNYWEKTINNARPLTQGVEGLVADEFWDLITDYEGTTAIIMEAFTYIGKNQLVERELRNLFSE